MGQQRVVPDGAAGGINREDRVILVFEPTVIAVDPAIFPQSRGPFDWRGAGSTRSVVSVSVYATPIRREREARRRRWRWTHLVASASAVTTSVRVSPLVPIRPQRVSTSQSPKGHGPTRYRSVATYCARRRSPRARFEVEAVLPCREPKRTRFRGPTNILTQYCATD